MWYGTLKRVVWNFDECGMVTLRYFEDGGVVPSERHGILKRVTWYFEKGDVALSSVIWYFEEGDVVL